MIGFKLDNEEKKIELYNYFFEKYNNAPIEIGLVDYSQKPYKMNLNSELLKQDYTHFSKRIIHLSTFKKILEYGNRKQWLKDLIYEINYIDYLNPDYYVRFNLK